jgi:hypothetical protein
MRPILLIIRFYSLFFFANFCISMSALGLMIFYGSKAPVVAGAAIYGAEDPAAAAKALREAMTV